MNQSFKSAYKPIQKITSGLPMPTFKKLTRLQLIELAHQGTGRESELNVLEPLLNRLQEFDSNQNDQENQTWVCKYAPVLGAAIVTDNGNGGKVTEWFQNRFHQLKRANVAGHKSLLKSYKKKATFGCDLDDFIIDEVGSELSETESQQSFLVLVGPSGSGKTSSVYAAAAEMDSYIFELNPSDKRSGKKLFEKLGGMGKSHLIHRGGDQDQEFKSKGVILLDEVDILFDEDQTFWAGLDKFIETSRRPVILTCQDPTFLPATLIENHSECLLQFDHASRSLQAQVLWLIALCEGHEVDMKAVKQLVHTNKGDFRSSLNNLQFWCQGLADQSCIPGHDHSMDDGKLMISETSFLGQSPDSIYFDYVSLDITASTGGKLEDWRQVMESLSDADCMKTTNLTQLEASLDEEYLADRMLGLAEIDDFPEPLQPLSFELSVHPTIAEMTFSAYPVDAKQPQKYPMMSAETMGESLWFLEGTGPIFTGVYAPSTRLLSTELLPVLRGIARGDKLRELEIEQIREMEEPPTRRSSRLSAAAQATGSRSLQPYLEGNLEDIIATAPTYWS